MSPSSRSATSPVTSSGARRSWPSAAPPDASQRGPAASTPGSAQQKRNDTGAGAGPEHAGERADDEALGRAGVCAVLRGPQLGVASQPLEGEHDREALGPAGDQRGEDRDPFERADPGPAAQ